MHSLAPKMGTTSVFINTHMHWGKMKTVGRGPKIEAKGQERGGVLREEAASPTS